MFNNVGSVTKQCMPICGVINLDVSCLVGGHVCYMAELTIFGLV